MPVAAALLAALLAATLILAPTVRVVPPAQSRRAMLLVHGGAWHLVGPTAVATMDADARFWSSRGWRVYTTHYAAGHASLAGVLATYDRIHAREPRGTPVCANGFSAGAHLTMLLALLRPSLRCAISLEGPTDLATVAADGNHAAGPAWVAGVARAQFGAFGGLSVWSPVSTGLELRVPLLMAAATNDPIVPMRQMTRMRDQFPRMVRTVTLHAGALLEGHSRVDGSDWQRFRMRELTFANRAAG